MVKNFRAPSVRERGYAGNNTQNFSEFPHLIISIKVEKQKSCSREKELWYWLFANVYFANIHIKTAQTNYRKWEIWCLKVILRNKRFFKALFVFLKNVWFLLPKSDFFTRFFWFSKKVDHTPALFFGPMIVTYRQILAPSETIHIIFGHRPSFCKKGY